MYMMTVKNMTEGDVGDYRVVAGPHSSTATLTLGAPKSKTTKLLETLLE